MVFSLTMSLLPHVFIMVAIAAAYISVPSWPAWCQPWVLCLGAALVAGLATGAVLPLGLLWIAVLTAALAICVKSPAMGWRLSAGFVAAILCLLLAYRLLPGFINPVVIAGARFSPDSQPYTQTANFDKGVAGLLLFALLARKALGALEWRMVLRGVLVWGPLTWGIVLGLAVLAGAIRPDFKVPTYTPIFLALNFFLTVVMEQSFIRVFVHDPLARVCARWRWGNAILVVVCAVVFGLVHAPGGLTLVVFSTIAGLGYSAAYAYAQRIEAAVFVHFLLNAIHFVFFSYPALAK
jgi:uncharacterized protein